MRKLLLQALLVLLILQCALVAAEKRMLMRRHDSHFNVKKVIMSLQQSIFADTDVDTQARACIKSGAKTCASVTMAQLQAETPEQRAEFGNLLKGQAIGLKNWIEAQGDNLTQDALFQYFNTNLINDPVTGQFWTCVQTSWKSCLSSQYDDEEEDEFYEEEDHEYDALVKKFTKQHKKLTFANSGQQQCAIKADDACGSVAAKWLSTYSKAQRANAAALINKQMRLLKRWLKAGDRSLEDTSAYITKHFYGTPTEPLWKCDVDGWQNCTKS